MTHAFHSLSDQVKMPLEGKLNVQLYLVILVSVATIQERLLLARVRYVVSGVICGLTN